MYCQEILSTRFVSISSWKKPFDSTINFLFFVLIEDALLLTSCLEFIIREYGDITLVQLLTQSREDKSRSIVTMLGLRRLPE